MGRFFLILLIALLPLRGWSAERMAVQMAISAPTSQSTGSGHGSMPDDCPMVLKAASTESGAHHGEGGRGCQACQLCMSLATFAIPGIPTISAKPICAPAVRADRFSSADLTRASKPPIS